MPENLNLNQAPHFWTGVHSSAEERWKVALEGRGIYQDVMFESYRYRSIALTLAIPQAGGRYYWWNTALFLWGGSIDCDHDGAVGRALRAAQEVSR